jgi:hypothetical protein
MFESELLRSASVSPGRDWDWIPYLLHKGMTCGSQKPNSQDVGCGERRTAKRAAVVDARGNKNETKSALCGAKWRTAIRKIKKGIPLFKKPNSWHHGDEDPLGHAPGFYFR